jgi:hypothetical protein
MPRTRSLAVLLLPAVALACGGPTLDDGFEDDLVVGLVCEDVYLRVHDEDDSVALTFRASDGPLASLAAGATELEYAIGEDAILYVELGRAVSDRFCEDEPSTRARVRTRYIASEGTARMRYVGGDSSWLALELTDVEVREEGGPDIVVIESVQYEFALD